LPYKVEHQCKNRAYKHASNIVVDNSTRSTLNIMRKNLNVE